MNNSVAKIEQYFGNARNQVWLGAENQQALVKKL